VRLVQGEGDIVIVTDAHTRLMGVVIVAVLLGSPACVQSYVAAQVEGTWNCTTTWTWDDDGEAVPGSYTQQATLNLKDNTVSATAVLSLGAAQWDETVEGTCTLSGDELHDTRTSVQTEPRNEAARQFERDRFEGQNIALATKAVDLVQHFRITSLTETKLTTIDGEGRISTCQRP
jgi:hypothetical protein